MLLAIIGFKDPVCDNVDILIDLLKRAGIQVIVCSGNSMENVMSFAEENSLIDPLTLRQASIYKLQAQKTQDNE